MYVTVASFKGGVGKSTTAVHLAAYLRTRGTVLLVDGDANGSALEWAKAGNLPFDVLSDRAAAKHYRNYDHVVIDTQARPSRDELQDLVKGCDLLVIPATPDALSLNALMLTVEELRAIKGGVYRILLTVVPPAPSRAGEEARHALEEIKLPLFKGYIRRFVAFQKAALEGRVVLDVRDEHAEDGWADYEAVGKELFRK